MKFFVKTSLLFLILGQVINGETEKVDIVKRDHTSGMSGASTTDKSLTNCHFHGNTQYCVDSAGNEGSIEPTPTDKASAPTEYTGCHMHGDDIMCSHGDDFVEFKISSDNMHGHDDTDSDSDDNDHSHHHGPASSVTDAGKISGNATSSSTASESTTTTSLRAEAAIWSVPVVLLVFVNCLL